MRYIFITSGAHLYVAYSGVHQRESDRNGPRLKFSLEIAERGEERRVRGAGGGEEGTPPPGLSVASRITIMEITNRCRSVSHSGQATMLAQYD